MAAEEACDSREMAVGTLCATVGDALPPPMAALTVSLCWIHIRYMTDLRTGAAGGVCVKHFVAKHHTSVGFIGAGAIAKVMAQGADCVHKFKQGCVRMVHPTCPPRMHTPFTSSPLHNRRKHSSPNF